MAVLMTATLLRAEQEHHQASDGVARGAPVSAGHEIYTNYCSACHLPSGLGNPPLVPALAGNDALRDEEHVIRMVRQGRGVMPPFKRLEPGELAAVANYVRMSWGNGFGAVNPQRVAEIARELDLAIETNASTSGGYFTNEQAARGQEIYLQRCAQCHGADFVPDDFAPGLTAAAFEWRWSDRTAYDLFTVIQSTMPPGEGGTLGPKTTVDVVSYLLQANGFPSGPTELRPEPELLQRLKLRH